jgi:hypothetical protein
MLKKSRFLALDLTPSPVITKPWPRGIFANATLTNGSWSPGHVPLVSSIILL